MSDYRVINDNGYERTWEELYEDNVRFQKYTDKLEKENEQLKDNWNELKDYIVKEYYLFIPSNASTSCITKLIEKMQELEGSDSNVNENI